METITQAYNLKSVSFTQDAERPYILNIHSEDEYCITHKIGHFNFFHKVGSLTLLNGNRKEFKQWQSLFNTFFKYDEMFSWTSTPIDAAKQAGRDAIKAEKKQAEKEIKEDQTNKAYDYLSKVTNKDQTTISNLKIFADKTDAEILEIINRSFKNVISKVLVNDILNAIKESFQASEDNIVTDVDTTEVNNSVFIAFNRTFQTWLEAYEYCKCNDFDYLLIEEVASEQPSNEPKTEVEPTVTYHFYKQTFNTYMDAYNYALRNMSPVTMVIASNHPYMTNERLQHLEKEYTFAKGNMSITDMKEYFQYISDQPHTLDQEERYYKLKSYIQRYESKQDSIKQREQQQKQYAIDIDNMLKDLYAMGMTKKEYTSLVTYTLNDEKIYSWSSGIPVERMHEEVTEVYNRYYKQSEAV